MTNTEQRLGDVFKLGHPVVHIQHYDIYESCVKGSKVPQDGEGMIRLGDKYHALCNSDQYPVPYGVFTSMENRPEFRSLSAEMCLEMFKAVIDAIDDCPRYKVHKVPAGLEVRKEEADA